MEEFLAQAGAPAPEGASSARGIIDSARRALKKVGDAVLPRRGFVRGVAERWTEAHLTPPHPTKTSGFEPYSPEKLATMEKLNLSGVDHSPERVGPSSFERRRRLIVDQILNA